MPYDVEARPCASCGARPGGCPRCDHLGTVLVETGATPPTGRFSGALRRVEPAGEGDSPDDPA